MFITSENDFILVYNIIYFYSSDLNFPYDELYPFVCNKNITCVDLCLFKTFCKRFSIQEVPTLLVFKDNKEIKRLAGMSQLNNIFDFLMIYNTKGEIR